MPLREERYKDFWKLHRTEPNKRQGVGGECSWWRIYLCILDQRDMLTPKGKKSHTVLGDVKEYQ